MRNNITHVRSSTIFMYHAERLTYIYIYIYVEIRVSIFSLKRVKTQTNRVNNGIPRVVVRTHAYTLY